MRGTRNTKEARKKNLVRLVCLILAILMAGSGVTVLLYVFSGQLNVAADSAFSFPSNLIAVGLECGTSEVAVGFNASTTNGFVVSKVTIANTVRKAESIYSLSQNDVAVVCDATLSKNGGKYVKYNGQTAAVGGYHLEIREKIGEGGTRAEMKISSADELSTLVNNLNQELSGSNYAVIPCYINDKYVIRIGDFSSVDKLETAKSYINEHTSISANYGLVMVEATSTGVSVVDPNLNKILFEYDTGGFSQIGLNSKKSGDYLKTYQSRLYGGTMCYKRSHGGIQVTSLIDFEEYVKCVVPWEISSSWNYNALTAFSIVVRSYAVLRKNGRMGSYGIDLFDDSTDQNYGGYTKVTARVEQAVNETRGKVSLYNGKIAQMYYSSSTGGYVVSNKYVWGSSEIPYLATKETPWENYPDRSRGLWFKEVSPSELSAYLRDTAACANLTMPIASVKINSTGGGSGYVTSITYTDTAGNTATVGNTSAKVKSSLYDLTYSANFVIGKGSVEYTYNVINDISLSEKVESGGEVFVEKYPTYFGKFSLSGFSVRTASKKLSGVNNSALSLITHSGRKTVTTNKANALSASSYHKLVTSGVDVDNIYTNAALDLTTLQADPFLALNADGAKVFVDYDKKTVTAYAQNSENFIIVGKGWGHGVGMSQWGVLDLANAGMSGPDILETYFPGTKITKVN